MRVRDTESVLSLSLSVRSEPSSLLGHYQPRKLLYYTHSSARICSTLKLLPGHHPPDSPF